VGGSLSVELRSAPACGSRIDDGRRLRREDHLGGSRT
jgi:hypothetical protein